MAVNDANKNQNQKADAPKKEIPNNNVTAEEAKTLPNIDTIASLFISADLAEMAALMYILDNNAAKDRVKVLLHKFNKKEKAVEQAVDVYADIMKDIGSIMKGNSAATEKARGEAYASAFSSPAMELIGTIGFMVFMVDTSYVPERFTKEEISFITSNLQDKYREARAEQDKEEEKLTPVPSFSKIFSNFTDNVKPPKDGSVWLSDVTNFFPRIYSDVARSMPSFNFKFNPF